MGETACAWLQVRIANWRKNRNKNTYYYLVIKNLQISRQLYESWTSRSNFLFDHAWSNLRLKTCNFSASTMLFGSSFHILTAPK